MIRWSLAMLVACSPVAPVAHDARTGPDPYEARAAIADACGPSPLAPTLRWQFDIEAELDRALLTLPEHEALNLYLHRVDVWSACVEGRGPTPH